MGKIFYIIHVESDNLNINVCAALKINFKKLLGVSYSLSVVPGPLNVIKL